MRWAVIVLMVLLAVACSESASSEDGIAAACEASLAVVDPLIGVEVEVEADGPTDVEGWALVFAHSRISPGDELTVSVDEELKIVWRLGGDGDASFRAVGPEGTVEPLIWGPEGPRGSNWERPGEEWGTGWILPSDGCWTLEATRGQSVLSISVEAA